MFKKNKYSLLGFAIVSVFFFDCNNQEKYPSTCKQVLDKYSYYSKKEMDSIEMNLLINSLKDILRRESNCIYSSLLLSDIYFSTIKYGEAQSCLLKAIEIDEKNVYALFKLGTIYSLKKQYDSAIVCFRSAAKAKSHGRIIIDVTKGFSEITETPHFEIEYSEIIFNNAVASYQGGYLVDAMNEFNYCISNEIRLKESYFFRGLLYIRIKYYKEACKDFVKAKEYGNSEADEYLNKYCN